MELQQTYQLTATGVCHAMKIALWQSNDIKETILNLGDLDQQTVFIRQQLCE